MSSVSPPLPVESRDSTYKVVDVCGPLGGLLPHDAHTRLGVVLPCTVAAAHDVLDDGQPALGRHVARDLGVLEQRGAQRREHRQRVGAVVLEDQLRPQHELLLAGRAHGLQAGGLGSRVSSSDSGDAGEKF